MAASTSGVMVPSTTTSTGVPEPAGLPAVGQRGDAGEAGVEAEPERSEHEQHEAAGGEAEPGALHDRAADAIPHAAMLLGVGRGLAHSQAIDVVAQQGQDRRQQCECREHGRDDHTDGADAERDEDRGRHEEHRRERQHHDEAGEEDRAAGRAARALDGVHLLVAALALLAVARDDEERVIDAHCQADHGDHVGDEERQLQQLADERGQAEGHDDGRDGQQDGHDGGHHRAEDDDEDDEGDGDADAFATLERLLREVGEVVVERAVTEGADGEALRHAHLIDDRVHLARDLLQDAERLGLDDDGQEGGSAVLGDGAALGQVAAHEDRIGLTDERAQGLLQLPDVGGVLGVGDRA
jgi:hypothetical protein